MDYEKAFDKIEWRRLLHALRRMGIDWRDRRLIGNLYMGQQMPQSALKFCPIHCPNGRLGQDLGFGGIAFALKLPELLNRNLAAVRANIFFP